MQLAAPAPEGQAATGSQFSTAAYTSKFVDYTHDVAAADPSVRLIFTRASYHHVYTIHCFSLFGDNMGMNGLYGIAPKQRHPPDSTERIEILKGTDTFVNSGSLDGYVGGATNNRVEARDQPTGATLDEHARLAAEAAAKRFGIAT